MDMVAITEVDSADEVIPARTCRLFSYKIHLKVCLYWYDVGSEPYFQFKKNMVNLRALLDFLIIG